MKQAIDDALRDRKDHVKGGGERQAAATVDGIRSDHVDRYRFATRFIPAGAIVCDAACGVGYGAWILANETNAASIVGVDLSEDAIAYANDYYQHERISFRKGDCLAIDLETDSVDVFVSFETVEHIPNAPAFLREVGRVLKPTGRLIVSTPNEELMPFSREAFPFHVRHYRPDELTGLLGAAGFAIETVASNKHRKKGGVIEGWEGPFNIVVCRPRPSSRLSLALEADSAER